MSITLAPIESPSRTASSAKVEPPDTSGSPGLRPANGEFGHIMSEVLQSSSETPALPAGQEVAATAEVQTGWPGALGGNLGASFGGEFLKAVQWGPHMQVITSEASVPDEQSLEAFARSQGLDETAVQWLMGSAPVAAPVAAPAPTTASVGMPSLLSASLQSAIDAPHQTGGMAPLDPAQVAAPTVGTSLGSAPSMGDHLSAMGLHATPLAQPGQANTSAGQPYDAVAIPGPSTGPFAASASTPSAVTGLDARQPDGGFSTTALSAAALWAMTQGTEKARVTTPPPAQEDAAEVAKVQINLLASAAPAAFWMLRNPMVAAPAKEIVTPASGIAVSEIDLSQTATPEVLDSLTLGLADGAGLPTAAQASEQPAPLSGHPGHRMEVAAAVRQDNPNTPASAPTPNPSHTQRSENVQNLAEKMGQAVGQRILSEIEKGQWHLKLSLRPATLGHIEVEMRMRSGELDAVFTAPQALTRELLQEGMSKLKDTLSQMGMDVASMQVGDGQTQKRGGESTPGQMSKSTNSGVDDPQSSLSATPPPIPRMKMGQDGWDVLV
ncbi:flagellar hook-length control protein FliK [Limnohabitans sp. DCL3]|uniref:flagellar hook-length control protein FliK n=1 Tax=Limnohabitans sp. DCL3 TaxID=3374103 RepID=UPI003A8C8341